MSSLEAWLALQEVCSRAARIAEREVSGIRDDDGLCYGSEFVARICSELIAAAERVMGVAGRNRKS